MISKLCRLYGYSRQAYYKKLKNKEQIDNELYSYVLQRRKLLPFEGVKKLHVHINRDTNFRSSRSQLYKFLVANWLIIKRKRRYLVLTDSSHPNQVQENLIKGFHPGKTLEVLVSDITYLKTKQGFYYLTAIMDLYSRKILSYSLTNNLGTEGIIRAFNQVINSYSTEMQGCIFHSDRGVQFCNNSFRSLAEQAGVVLSNSARGNPYENACMERLFATLKSEYLLKISFPDIKTLTQAVKDAVTSYNNIRLHWGIDLLTPKMKFEQSQRSY